MKRRFRLIPALAPFWQRYDCTPSGPAIVCLAQRGPELWTVRAEGGRCWMQQGPAWYELSASSARKLLLQVDALQHGADGRLCLTLRPCRALGAAATDAAPPAADAAASPAGDHDVVPLRAWSGSQTPPPGPAPTVHVVHKRSRRFVRPGVATALAE